MSKPALGRTGRSKDTVRSDGRQAALGLPRTPHVEEFLMLMRERQTVRPCAERPLSKDVLEQVLEAGRWAPSAHNVQPWRFVVVGTRQTKERLAIEMAAYWERDPAVDEVPPKIIQGEMSYSKERLSRAPYIVIPCLDMGGMDEYPDSRRQQRN